MAGLPGDRWGQTAQRWDLVDRAERAGADPAAMATLRATPAQPSGRLTEVLRVVPKGA
ncbi:hypothetical protein M8C13_16020 [Crossiella sp. SN42]|uniref:hypothetical protein n=1 Tax=Crossiella sp. SN42 TaxID=2944808 RepID=UPI00207C4C95|nr:hypothetical protein [Crossiella sp. SN42]MCO1577263.1 hypothetical protein [Crossiella sp. SN42]